MNILFGKVTLDIFSSGYITLLLNYMIHMLKRAMIILLKEP